MRRADGARQLDEPTEQLDAHDAHTEARALGTGMVTVTSALGERRLIVKKSRALAAFEVALAAMREAAP